jgi:hypothetical protein
MASAEQSLGSVEIMMFSPFDLSLTEADTPIVARAAKSRNKKHWRVPASAYCIASKTGFPRARKYWTRKGEVGLEYRSPAARPRGRPSEER